jgi:hypothetical protein
MSRRINTVSLQAAGGGGEKPDDYTDRIVKYIPADIVAAWLAVTSAIKSAANPPSVRTLWLIFAVGAIFAALWTWRKASEPGKPAPYIQTAVSTLAFFVWAYATGGVLPQWPGNLYQPLNATLLLVGFSLVSGLITKA